MIFSNLLEFDYFVGLHANLQRNKDRVCFRGRKSRASLVHVFRQDAVIRQRELSHRL